jgi:hypothetical protein
MLCRSSPTKQLAFPFHYVECADRARLDFGHAYLLMQKSVLSVNMRGSCLDRSLGQLETEIVIIRDVAKEVVRCCEQHRMLHVLSIASGKKNYVSDRI